MILAISVSFCYFLFISNENENIYLANLGEQLQNYVDKLDKVRLIRAKRREGLIRARLMGAAKATSEVLIFLDSHCECSEGWLEPLVDPIARNPNSSTVPIIERIDDNTFEIHVK